MSKLDDLINKLCPNGVEYKKLGDFASVIRGGNFQKKDFVETGKPCIHYGQMYTHFKNTTDKTLTFVSDSIFEKSKQAQPNDIVMAVTSENVEDVCSCVAWLGKENIAVSGHTAIIHHNQNPSYLSYYFHSELFFKQKVKLAHGTKVIEVTPDKLLGLEIPVPPLEVQNEIVRILDKFTSLEAELEAELEARRKQYEYYRDSLLTFGDDVEWKSLSEVTTSIKNIKWKQETNSYQYIDLSSVDRDTHSIGETTSINPETAPSRAQQIVNENDVLFGGTRPMLKRFCLISNKYNNQICSTGFCVLRANPEKILPKWIYYNLGTDTFYKHVEQYQSGASYPAISDGDVKRYKIAIPSLEEQEKIINLLDRFEALCNDITSGLPAEIEARHKQYEYYRDKLLTFKRKEA